MAKNEKETVEANAKDMTLNVSGKDKGRIGSIIQKIVIYVLCTFLAILSILPFWMMFVNATRSTPQIQQTAVSFIPSTERQRRGNLWLQEYGV